MSRPVSMVLVIVAAALLGACSAFAPIRDESRFYVLNAVTAPNGAERAASDVIVGVGPVVVPQYLDRAEIVARVGMHQIVPVANARWGEPLQPNLARVLAEDLAIELGTGQVLVFPWFGAAQPMYGVAVDVQRFEAQDDGNVRLYARWTVRHLPTKTLTAVRETNALEPAARNDAAAAVQAMSRTVAALGAEIGAVIRGDHHARATGASSPPASRARRTSRH
jgi:uncharacterized lipoprotein YmbA